MSGAPISPVVAPGPTERTVLDVSGLQVTLIDGGSHIVESVSLAIKAGETLALVGESGSGKTTVALGLLGYSRPGSRITGGRVVIGGVDIVALPPKERRKLRGSQVAYVGQDPGTSFNPARTIRRQMEELLRVHGVTGDEASGRIAMYLQRVALPSEPSFTRRYPHQLSGGQLQRVSIAMALSTAPSLIVLDEPTTALDVLVQREVLNVIREVRDTHEVAMLYVTHDLAVVSEIADRVAVMYGGQIIELGETEAILVQPAHPYTSRLLEAVPDLTQEETRLRAIPGTAVGVRDREPGCPFRPRCELAIDRCATDMPPVTDLTGEHSVRCWVAAQTLAASTDGPDAVPAESSPSESRVRPAAVSGGTPTLLMWELTAWFPRGGGLPGLGGKTDPPRVLNAVSLDLGKNEILGVVGETGSGKTTLARCVAGLHPWWDGTISLDGVDLAARARDRESDVRRSIQLVFQNPATSLNPRQTVGQMLRWVIRRFDPTEAGRVKARAQELMDLVRLNAPMLDMYPRQLSGGERQRVAIARALAARPRVLLCDEVTSALDVSVQASVIELIGDLRSSIQELSVLFISHDLAVVRAISDRVAVLWKGDLVESGSVTDVLFSPTHPYTHALMNAPPRLRRTAD